MMLETVLSVIKSNTIYNFNKTEVIMKKYFYFFIAGLLSLNLLACNPVNGGTENSEDTDKTGEVTDTEESSKKEGYEILVGTKWNLEEKEDYDDFTKKNAYRIVIFKQDEIVVDDKSYSIENSMIKEDKDDLEFLFSFDSNSLRFEFCYNFYGIGVSLGYVYIPESTSTSELRYILDTSYTGDNGDSSTGEDENLELSGEYVISENHRYGNLVFSNGSWNVTQGTSSGTYSLNGNVLTVIYDAYGTVVSADFTVSVSSSELILQSSNPNVAAAVLGGFGVQDLEALNTGKITLTKN